MVHCVFHKSDLDGICSGAIVYYKFGRQVRMVGYEYHEPLPDFLSRLAKDDVLFLVDISFPLSVMKKLCKQCRVIYIDHHKTAIKEFEELPLEGLQVIGTAACELVWKYCFRTTVPYAVKLLSWYDTWQTKRANWESEILPFQFRMKSLFQKKGGVFSEEWTKIFEATRNKLQKYINEGKAIREFIVARNEQLCDFSARTMYLGPHKCLAINCPFASSGTFDSVVPYLDRSVKFLLAYSQNTIGLWKISLYQIPGSDFDVSEIAKRFGGGGHAGAAGFYTKTLRALQKKPTILSRLYYHFKTN